MQGRLIDAANEDHAAADALLEVHPELLNAREHLGETALHFCIVESQFDAARYLLRKGASPDVVARHGMGPLHDACVQGNTEAVRLLLEYRADTTVRSNLGTPLEVALAFEQHRCAALLKERTGSGPDIA